MCGVRFWTVILSTALILALFSLPAAAQVRGTSELRHTFSLSAWFTSATATEPAGTGSWRTTWWLLDYRLTSENPWGVHLRFGTGSQGSFGGTFAGATAGSDRLWSADVSYRVRSDPATVRVFAGYGSIQWETVSPARRVSSSGFRIGANLSLPLQMARGPSAWSVHADVAWSPSNSVRSLAGGVETVTSGGATEFAVGVRYKVPSARATQISYLPAAFTTLQDDFEPSWSAELVYRIIGFSGSDYRWSGLAIGFNKTF